MQPRIQQVCLFSILLLVVHLGALQSAPEAHAQDRIRRVTLAEALDLFARNNLSLLIARSEAREVASLARQSTAYPNPTLALTHEPLFGDRETTSETYFNMSQRFVWPSSRQARRDAADALARSARARVSADSVRLAAEVAVAYVTAAAAQDRSEHLESVTAVFRGADVASDALVREGDLSGYDLRRLRVERARYETALAQAELDVRDAHRKLTLLVLPSEADIVVAPATQLSGISDAPAFDEVLRRSVERRPELLQAQADVEAARASLEFARRARIPEPTATAGVKRQSNDVHGLFLGLSAPLPFFDRNHGEIAAQQARLDAAEIRLQLARRQLEQDVGQAYDRHISHLELLRRIERELLGEADALLRIARVSYDEGEMTLLELLDAAEAYRDARLANIDLLADYWRSYYDLVRASGGDISTLIH
jgi:outer membrane protein, heavy metal efflux system